MKAAALIPARKGSEGIPNKNFRPNLMNYTLLALGRHQNLN